MFSADSSAMIAFFQKNGGDDVSLLRSTITEEKLFLPLPVVTELLSDPKLQNDTYNLIQALPTLPILDGYWHRTGKLRALILSKGKKARLGDCLIAQNCIDNNVAIITRDTDFRHFANYSSLMILPNA